MQTTLLQAQLAERGFKFIDLAELVGVHKAQITRWARGKVPADRVLEIERLTGIPRHDLRPDLYPLEAAE